MPHFFINSDNVTENTVLINDKENYNHIAKSLRARIGEEIKLCDETEKLYKCKIKAINKTEIWAEILSTEQSARKLLFDLSVAQSPLRSDAQLTLIEKVTELGVNRVYPIYTDNCALPQNIAAAKTEKWQKTMYEASKQCERANIPICESLTVIDKLPFNEFNKIIVFAERNENITLKEFINQNPINEKNAILVIIGPEGGFSDREFELFKSKNFPLATLGRLILKAETAAITGIGNLIYGYSK